MTRALGASAYRLGAVGQGDDVDVVESIKVEVAKTRAEIHMELVHHGLLVDVLAVLDFGHLEVGALLECVAHGPDGDGARGVVELGERDVGEVKGVFALGSNCRYIGIKKSDQGACIRLARPVVPLESHFCCRCLLLP